MVSLPDSVRNTELPEELIKFLVSGESLHYYFPECEAKQVVLQRVDSLLLEEFYVESWDITEHALEDPHSFEGHYVVPGVPLVAACVGSSIAPRGVLVWFPHYREFGQVDMNHHQAIRFRGVVWSDIVAEPLPDLNAKWSLDLSCIEYLQPWRDGGAEYREGEAPLSSRGPIPARGWNEGKAD